MNSRAITLWTVPLALALVLGGCGYQRTPVAMDTELRGEDIDEVVVLPVLDARPVSPDQVQVTRNVGDATVRYLRERGYFTLEADRFRERPPLPLDLKLAGPDLLMPLAPEDSRFFMLVQVLSLEPGVSGDGQTYDAQLAAVLVDRTERRVIWRDIATGSSSLNGMLTVFSRGSRQYEASVNASRELVSTLPDRRAKKSPR